MPVVYFFKILEASDLMILQDNMNDYGASGYTAVGPVAYDPSGNSYIVTLKQVSRV